MADSKARDFIRSQMQEGMQTSHVYDAAGRIESLFEAPINVTLGQPCLLTEFKYVGGALGTNRNVLAMRESVGAWPLPDFDALP